MPAGDGDIRIEFLSIQVSRSLPGSAARAFDKSKPGVEFDGAGVVMAHVKPDVIYFFLVGVLHGAFGEGAGNAFAAVRGMHGDVGDEIDAFFVMSKGDEAGVADDVSALFPDVTRERQGCGFGGAVGPFDEGVVAARAAHILHVAPAIGVHSAGEAQFDEVCDGWKITQDAEGAQVGMVFSTRGDGDGGHAGIIVGLGMMNRRQKAVVSRWSLLAYRKFVGSVRFWSQKCFLGISCFLVRQRDGAYNVCYGVYRVLYSVLYNTLVRRLK